jgi:hypothetical protein
MKMSSKREGACVTWTVLVGDHTSSQGNELLTVLIGDNSEIKCSCEDSGSSSGEMLRIAGNSPRRRREKPFNLAHRTEPHQSQEPLVQRVQAETRYQMVRCPWLVAARSDFFAGAERPTRQGRDSTQGQLRLFNGSPRNFKAAIAVPLCLPTIGLNPTRLSLSRWLL